MRRTLTLPKLGLTMTEGVVAEWLKQPGDRFSVGDFLYVVENDKAASEIEAEADGTLLEIVAPAGTTVLVGDVIGYWEAAEGAASPAIAPDVEPAETDIRPATAETSGPSALSEAGLVEAPSPSVPKAAIRTPEGRVIASPYARKLAKDRNVPLTAIAGTGPNGRVVARDVPLAPVPAAVGSSAELAPVRKVLLPGQTLTPPTAVQSVVARRLVASKQQIPHFYLTLDVDVTRLLALRREINHAPEARHLTVNHFVVLAVARALERMPEANQVWTDEGILSFGQVDVGIAISTDQGLMAPAVVDVGRVSMLELAERLDSLIDRTRAGRMNQRDLGQAALTVSNAGMYNVRYMASIINPGQSMILGVGGIRSVFVPDDDGHPKLCEQMGLVLSADHRVLDGVQGLKFLNMVAGFLEQPVSMLVQ